MRRQGIAVDVLFIDGARQTIQYLLAFPRLWRALRRHDYDLVHAHHPLSGLVARAQLCCPVVLTQHGFIEVAISPWQSAVSAVLRRVVDGVVYVSDELRDVAGDERGWVIPCGVDEHRFHAIDGDDARRFLGIGSATEAVLFAADPTRPEKRFELAREVVNELAVRGRAVQLVVAATASHDLMPWYMAACDALLLTSSTEGSPVVVKEAIACGLPVVSTAVGDVPRLPEGLSGCATADDVGGLAQALDRILESRSRLPGDSLPPDLTVERSAERLAAVYADVVRRSRHAF